MRETRDVRSQILYRPQSPQARNGQVGDAVDLVFLPERSKTRPVGDIDLLNLYALMVFVLDEAGFSPGLEVGDDHVFTCIQESTRRVQSDEPHPARNKRRHARPPCVVHYGVFGVWILAYFQAQHSM